MGEFKDQKHLFRTDGYFFIHPKLKVVKRFYPPESTQVPFHVFDRGAIPTNIKRRRPGMWQLISDANGVEGLFLTCISCMTILRARAEDVGLDGGIGIVDGEVTQYSCIACHKCGLHQWVLLNGWKRKK
jgi:hypothetical protein